MMIENHYYLFVHFRETTTPDGEQVYFALSKDGFHWEALNNGRPVLWAYYGDLLQPYQGFQTFFRAGASL